MSKQKLASQQSSKISVKILVECFFIALKRLTPLYLLKNPVMFVTYIGCVFISFVYCYGFIYHQFDDNPKFMLNVIIWLWFTVIFSNFSESIAEYKGKAQAKSLRSLKQELLAKKVINEKKEIEIVNSCDLRRDDIVLVEAQDIIPSDGIVIDGIAAVDESPVTGESAPVIRDKSEEKNSVVGGTQVLSDWIIVRIIANPGETFLDKMISLVEGAKRQKTPNEIALSILLSAFTLIFLVVVMAITPFSRYSINFDGGNIVSLTQLVSFLICLIPTTIGGLMSAIGIAGMDRLIRHNVIANSGRAVEAAGDVSMLLLDKTGTITMGNRQAVAFYPAKNTSEKDVALYAKLSSLGDETPEGKSIVTLANTLNSEIPLDFNIEKSTFIPFTAETRMSGINFDNIEIRKGSVDRMIEYISNLNGEIDSNLLKKVDDIATKGATPLLVSLQNNIIGAIELKDIIKPGIKARLSELRTMGITSIMITGDNPLTAASISNEAGVDDFFAKATPEMKLNLIRKNQENGQLIAMVGDGTNDAPALAQTDVALAMNSGTQAAKEAANMIDLDSDPTKLLEIVKIGKEFLITRGALTTFSITNDIGKYFTLLPCALSITVPEIAPLNILNLGSPHSAVLATVIFNALIIVGLIPLALRGIKFKPMHVNQLLLRHTLIYGIGGTIVPFVFIKFIDYIINSLGIV